MCIWTDSNLALVMMGVCYKYGGHSNIVVYLRLNNLVHLPLIMISAIFSVDNNCAFFDIAQHCTSLLP